jgi:hypothetical protein
VAGGTLGLREGAANLEVRARDGFWRPIRVDDRMIANRRSCSTYAPTLEIPARRGISRGGGALAAVRAGRRARRRHVGDLSSPASAGAGYRAARGALRAAAEPGAQPAGHRHRPGRGVGNVVRARSR